jgi:hypothetical protein
MDANAFLAAYSRGADVDPDRLDDPAFRDTLYRALHPTPAPNFLPLVRDPFRREAKYRADESSDGEYFENLYWAALFLYRIGSLDDVLPMWRAKHMNMDTGGGFDIQFLVGQGVTPTIAYLRMSNDPVADEAADCIVECRDAGDLDHLDEWLSDRIDYFR